jgi:hypothetical protein
MCLELLITGKMGLIITVHCSDNMDQVIRTYLKNCYSCLTNTLGIVAESKRMVKHPNLPQSQGLCHTEKSDVKCNATQHELLTENQHDIDQLFHPSFSSTKPH